MKLKRICFLVIAVAGLSLALGAAGSTWADLYKWVDENGVIHFADQPPPAETQRRVETMPSAPPSTFKPPPPAAKTPEASPAKEMEAPPKPAKSVHVPKVTLYVTSWCKYCKLARKYLQAHRISFTEYDIEKDPAAAVRRRQIDPRPGVPLALIDGTVIIGFSEEIYEQALEAARLTGSRRLQ